VAVISGSYTPATAAPHLILFKPEGRNGGGSWTAMNVSLSAYFYAQAGGLTQSLHLTRVDNGVGGAGFDAFDEIRWIAYHLSSGSFTGSAGTLSSDLVCRLEQINK